MSAGVLTDERSRRARALPVPSIDLAAIAAWALPFIVVLYLALKGGGYDSVVRGQVGLLLWWGALIAALAGVVPALSRSAWSAIGLLAAFVVWTALSLLWTESDERTVLEVARAAALLGVLVVGLALTGRGHGRQVVAGLAWATGLVALLAVLSRLRPGWFPPNDVAQNLGDFRRLAYPLNYWNALAAFIAVGLAPMLSVAAGARSLLVRSAAAGAVPVMALCVFLTASRGGFAAGILAIVVFVVLAPDRLARLGSLAVVLAGSGVLIAAAAERDAARNGERSALASQQANDLLVIIVLTVLAVAALHLAVALVDRHVERPRWAVVPRRRAVRLTAVAVVVGIALAVVAGVPGTAQHAWNDFKSPGVTSLLKEQDTTFSRLATLAGSGRYQYWQSASAAQQTKPLEGRGAGTFEYWWARRPNAFGGFVRDAHSLYMQTLAELGIVGLVLLAGLLVLLLVRGIWRSLSLPPHLRLPTAAATAGIVAFTAQAGVDWVSQVTVVPTAVMLLAAVILARDARRTPTRGLTRPLRAAVAAVAMLCLVPLGVTVASGSALADSQQAANRGDLAAALASARSAAHAQPYAASPRLQEALVLEAAGRPAAAAQAASSATARESTNWRTWLIRSRIDAELGHAAQAIQLFRHAQSLNPHSPIFASAR